MRTFILTGLGAVFSCSALAYDRIPAEDGLSGSVFVGAVHRPGKIRALCHHRRARDRMKSVLL